jgi:hypothetical protein
MTWRAPTRDLASTLNEVVGIANLTAAGAFPGFDGETLAATLDAGGRVSDLRRISRHPLFSPDWRCNGAGRRARPRPSNETTNIFDRCICAQSTLGKNPARRKAHTDRPHDIELGLILHAVHA